MTTLPDHLRGDGPCQDCGTEDNIVWTVDSVFWNRVIGGPGTRDDPGGIVCVLCFVKRTDEAGLAPLWRLVPEFHWETKAERDVRRTTAAERPAEGGNPNDLNAFGAVPSVPQERTE